MSRVSSPVLENLSSLEKIIEFINGIKSIKDIGLIGFPLCFKACWIFAYDPSLFNKSIEEIMYFMIQDLNKLSITNNPLVYHFINGMIIEFVLQNIKERRYNQDNLFDMSNKLIIQRNETIQKILELSS